MAKLLGDLVIAGRRKLHREALDEVDRLQHVIDARYRTSDGSHADMHMPTYFLLATARLKEMLNNNMHLVGLERKKAKAAGYRADELFEKALARPDMVDLVGNQSWERDPLLA